MEHTSSRLADLFKSQLATTQNLDEVREVIKRLGLNLAHDPSYSELAFDYILTTNYKLAGEFLLDPSLNPPAASNYSRVVMYLKEKVADSETRKTLLQTVFKGFSLGVIRREQAQLILQTLPEITINSKDGPVSAGNTPRINKYYSIILKCLTECNVFSTRDLGVEVLNAWIGYIERMPPDRYAAALILSLTKSVALSQTAERPKSDSRAFYVFMSQIEVATTSDLTERWLKYLCEQPARREHHLRHLACFLSKLSPAVLRSIVIRMPTRLVISIHDEKLNPEVLRMWEQVLLLFDKKTVGLVLGEATVWTKKVNEINIGLSADSRLLLRLWTALTLCNGAGEPLRTFNQMDFPSQLKSHFKENDPALLWDRMSLALQSLPKLRFRGQLFDLLNKLHQSQLAEDVVRTTKQQAVLDAFARQGFAVLQDNEVYRYALHHLNDPLKELAASVNKDITGFARIVLPLIAQDKLSLRIVTRLLRHNTRFHLALKNAWSLPPVTEGNVVKPRNRPNSLSQVTKLTTLLMTSDELNFHEAVLKFMHDLAIVFAVSPALSDRQALRKVFWCFSFLHRYGAPIHSPITKALWYAGVTRCEGKGTSRKVVLWLLRKIREVEGPATADELITNGNFRAKRASEVWYLGRKLSYGLAGDEERR